MRKYIANVATLLLLGSISFSGCGSDSGSEEEGTSLSTAPFLQQYARENEENDGTGLDIAFLDGIEIPNNHDYLLFGFGSIDKYNSDNHGDDALFARISSQDGSLKKATYVRYETSEAKNDTEKYIRSAILSYEENGEKINKILLVGTASPDATYQTEGLLVTLLNGDGEYEWSRHYLLSQGEGLEISEVAADGDGTFWVVGNGSIPAKNPDGTTYWTRLGIVIHIDAKTGEILQASHLGIDDGISNYFDVTVANDHVYISGSSEDTTVDTGINSNGFSDTVLLLELNKDATLASATKYMQKEKSFGERGEGIIYKDGNIYIAFETAGPVEGGIMKIDAGSTKELKTVKQLYTYYPYSYYRDFEIHGDTLYLAATNSSFYKTNLNGDLEKVSWVEGGWTESLFIDSAGNIVSLSHNGLIPRMTSFATKFSNTLATCGLNTTVADPENPSIDITTKWVAETIAPTYPTVPVALATNNAGEFVTGDASNIITQKSLCSSEDESR